MPEHRPESPKVTYYSHKGSARVATCVTFPVSGQTVYLRGRLPPTEAIARARWEVGPDA